MDPTLLGALGVGAMLVLLMFRVPIAFCMAAVGFVGMILRVGWPEGRAFDLARGFRAAFAYLSFEPFAFVANFSLVTLPMFLMMGYVAYHAGFTGDVYNTVRVWFGRMKGGLAIASVVGCAAFAAVSGSSLATSAAMGKLAVPEMLRRKYHPGLATGVVAASGTLGALIPPSVLLILYGVFTEQSIGRLLIAAMIPGVLSALIYMAMIWVRCALNPELGPPSEAATWRTRVVSLKGTWSIILLFTLVMGGIMLGIVTPTEAAAIGALGAWILGFLAKRLDRSTSSEAITETARQTANIFAIILGAKIFVGFISLTGFAGDLTGWATGLDLHPLVVLLAVSLVFIFLGTFMDPLGIMLLTLPLVTPVIEHLGYDLVWFGIIMVKFLEIGLITPPVGLNVYILKGVVGRSVPLDVIFKGITWFLMMDIVTLAILILLPQITLWLPAYLLDGR